MSKRVVVFGATGTQGGAVIRGLLALKQFTVVGVTRNPESDKAKALAKELSSQFSNFGGFVAGDLDAPETLREAVRGAWGVFAVTNWWEIFDTDREIKQGKAVIDAAREEKVQCVIYSGLPRAKDYDPSSTLYVDHLDGKREVELYLLDDSVNGSIPLRIATRVACYMQNWLSFFVARSYDGGKTYVMTLPMEDKLLQLVDVEAYGPFVAQVFANPEKFNKQTPTCTTDVISGKDVAAQISEAVGVTVVYNAMPNEQFAKLGFPHADELARMFKFFCDFWQEEAPGNLKLTRELNPQSKNFAQWAKDNAEALRKGMGLGQ